jgi:saccharopine dehydrogenase (NADP+, L-glutamate forming)
VPCAVAVKQVLEGTLAEKGILAPMSSKINDPLIKELHEVSHLYKYLSSFSL